MHIFELGISEPQQQPVEGHQQLGRFSMFSDYTYTTAVVFFVFLVSIRTN